MKGEAVNYNYSFLSVLLVAPANKKGEIIVSTKSEECILDRLFSLSGLALLSDSLTS